MTVLLIVWLTTQWQISHCENSPENLEATISDLLVSVCSLSSAYTLPAEAACLLLTTEKIAGRRGRS